ncbi:MAG: family 16 glycosylhydrolase [Granulosicoccus sp.]
MIFRQLILLLVSCALVATVKADTCGLPNESLPYRLVFNEEFNSGSLDRNRWTPELLWGPSLVINRESQYYVSEGQFGYDPFKFRNGVLSIEAIETPYDPNELYLTRLIPSANSARLLWREPAGAAFYRIYRDGQQQAVVTGDSYVQEGLRDRIDYEYEVVAFDSSGNELVSSELIVNTIDRGVGSPAKPFGLGLDAQIYGARDAEITWRAPNRAARFEILKNNRMYRTLRGTSYESLYETGLIEGTDYRYIVLAFDRCNELITWDSVTLNTSSGRTQLAELDPRLIVQVSKYSKTSAELFWNAVDGAQSYEVYENRLLLQSNDSRSRFIDDLVPGTNRRFTVVALDAGGNRVDETTRIINTADNSFAANRQPYLSGVITSYNSFRFRYGRVEARARMPAGKGLWSAFWLLNAYYNEDQPEDPEIDIIEAIGDRTTTANHAYHYMADNDDDGEFNDLVSQEFRAPMSDFSADFHVYRVDWEPGRIVWYVDDVETARVEGPEVSNEQMYIIANLAVGGTFPGPTDETTPFPARFDIDYIRVYQRR